ncbi:toll/interleukin-1 receptor domain-containing protein [Hyalangium versicolor]|uniref:toll/interleukin-1 receptor domain-containing protein n=1 Tax=Hyalangium versicolor TaxID=2861190 RepID=UPI001CCC9229|nr:toll/interleukin-1 receptor domain-containing protein [Hyalangium versicolor]
MKRQIFIAHAPREEALAEEVARPLEEAGYEVIHHNTLTVGDSTLARQLSGHSVKLLPVILTGGTPPAILADYRYADLGKDWNKGVAELLRAIQ